MRDLCACDACNADTAFFLCAFMFGKAYIDANFLVLLAPFAIILTFREEYEAD